MTAIISPGTNKYMIKILNYEVYVILVLLRVIKNTANTSRTYYSMQTYRLAKRLAIQMKQERQTTTRSALCDREYPRGQKVLFGRSLSCCTKRISTSATNITDRCMLTDGTSKCFTVGRRERGSRRRVPAHQYCIAAHQHSGEGEPWHVITAVRRYRPR